MKINYPCLLTEAKNKCEEQILNHFSLVENEKELQEQKKYYIEPVIIQNVGILYSAKKILKQYK